MRVLLAVATAVSVVALVVACSDRELAGPPGRAGARTERSLTGSPGQGLGIPLTPPSETTAAASLRIDSASPILDQAVAAVAIPTPGSDEPERIALVAFTTALDASRIDPRVTDDNDAADLFVGAVVDNQLLLAGVDLPGTFAEGLGQVFRDVRCIRCHSFQMPDGFRLEPQHRGKTLDNNECAGCHTQGAIREPGLEPEEIVWIAPDPDLDFRGKDFATIQREIIAREGDSLDEHLRVDDRILWALQHGRVPFQGMAEGGPIPISVEAWRELIDAWEVGGRRATNDGAVGEFAQQSYRIALPGVATPSGASRRPTAVFRADPTFAVASTTPASAGRLFVAFETDASELAPGATAAQIVLVEFDLQVRIDAAAPAGDDATRSALVARLDPVGAPRLVTAVGGQAANGASVEPSLALAGDQLVLAFSSAATDLRGDFVDGNGDGRDIWIATIDIATRATQFELLSASLADPSRGADGDSTDPHVATDGSAFAFTSVAGDLVGGDGNGKTDVFVRLRSGPDLGIRRVSVRDGGAPVDAASRRGRVWRDPATGDFWVVFESDASDLAGPPAASTSGESHAYLHWADPSRTFALTGAAMAPSQAPEIVPNGMHVVFLSPADLDPAAVDGNGLVDLYALDFAAFRAATPVGATAPLRRLSVTATGADASAASAPATTAAVANRPDDGVLLFGCPDELVGHADNNDLVVQFLRDRRELPLVAEFTATDRVSLVSSDPSQPTLPTGFRDLSTGATSWIWSFAEYDEQIRAVVGPFFEFSREPDPELDGLPPGNYAIRLEVGDDLGRSATTTKDGFVARFASRTWPEIYASHFVNGCAITGCHAGNEPKVGLDMSDARAAHRSLVDQLVQGCARDGTLKRVVPGVDDPAVSQLIAVIDRSIKTCIGPEEAVMELGRPAVLEVRDWIVRGAPLDLELVAFDIAADTGTNPPGGAAPFAVSFANRSAEDLAFVWDFGNGSESTERDPGPVTYEPGNYTITLRATDVDGTPLDPVSRDIVVISADFSASAFEIGAGSSIQFIDQSQNATVWRWDFGNGQQSTAQQPPLIAYASGRPDGFDVRLTTSTTTSNGTVTASRTRRVDVVEARFSFVPTSANSAEFRDESVLGTTRSWTFENGTPAAASAPTVQVTFGQNGSNDVTLRATGAGGATHQITRPVDVPLVGFDVTPALGTVETDFVFSYQGQANPPSTTIDWDFGDGTVVPDGGESIQHRYVAGSADGYDVTMTVRRPSATPIAVLRERVVRVTEARIGTITESTQDPFRFTFANDSIVAAGEAVSWRWDFDGNGSTDSTARSPSFRYSAPGNYTVRLRVIVAGTSHTDETPLLVETVRFSEVYDPIFVPNCNIIGCHGTNGVAPLMRNRTEARANLLQNAIGCGAPTRLVTPNNLGASVLMFRLSPSTTGSGCAVMPSGGPELPTAELNVIRAWIQSGAPQ